MSGGRRNWNAIQAYQHGWDDRNHGRGYRRNVGSLQYVDDYDDGWDDAGETVGSAFADLRRALSDFGSAIRAGLKAVIEKKFPW